MENINQTSIESNVISDVRPLIVEDIKRVVSETNENGKRKTAYAMRVTGIFQEAETQNANSRVYPTAILQEAVGSMQDSVKSRKVLGEFDHPSDAKIHLDRVSHLITRLWMEGNKVYGEAEVLEHVPYGQQLKGLLEQGVTVGVSSRGVGDMESVVQEGKQVFRVLPGYHLITFDAVAEPSVAGTELAMLEHRVRVFSNPLLIQKHKEYKLLEEIKRNLLK